MECSVEKKTILIVDSIQKDIEALVALLAEYYTLLLALDNMSAIEIAETEVVNLILLDIMLSDINGFEICTTLKSQTSTRDIPVIFVTGRTDEDSIEKAYNVGGIDYISKPFKPRELLARVKTHIKLRALVEDLEHIASYDNMTCVYNRRKFFYEAELSFNEIRVNLYAFMIDIDHFKNVNDTYGHAFGDKVIKLIAKTIEKNILEASIFGRVGGEEFALLCHSLNSDEVIQNMEKIRKSIEELEFVTDDGVITHCTISAGMAKSDKNTLNLDALLKRADDALYEAKGSGRNKAIFR